jgi:hypothetical protein
MKHLVLLLIAGSAIALSTRCTKDKAPKSNFDPTCSDTISFSQDVMPLITDNCLSCHDDGNSTGYTFTSHALISDNASDMLGAMRNEGFQLMPQGGPALPDSVIKIFSCWIQNNKPNN